MRNLFVERKLVESWIDNSSNSYLDWMTMIRCWQFVAIDSRSTRAQILLNASATPCVEPRKWCGHSAPLCKFHSSVRGIIKADWNIGRNSRELVSKKMWVQAGIFTLFGNESRHGEINITLKDAIFTKVWPSSHFAHPPWMLSLWRVWSRGKSLSWG